MTDEKLGLAQNKALYQNIITKIICVLSILLCTFHCAATFIGTVTVMKQKVIHLGLIMIIGTLIHIRKKINADKKIGMCEMGIDLFIIIVPIFFMYYISVHEFEIALRLGRTNRFEVILGVCTVISLLELTRRYTGIVLPCLGIIGIAYALVGGGLPFGLGHRGYPLARTIGYILLSDDGIFGIPLTVCAGVVVLFIIFGAFLQKSGAGETFIDLAFGIFGGMRGAPAKVAAVSSALFGTISGSAVANVVATGTFTIPLMKRVGYKKEFAGAVEAVASAGGQLMPPIMGAAAFIMAQILGLPYMTIALSATIPALLYFGVIFFTVDLQAVKYNLKGLPREELPQVGKVFKERWFLLLPMAVLLFMLLAMGYTPSLSALYCTGFCIIVSWFTKNNKMKLKEIVQAMIDAANDVMSVALCCATAGIFVGVLGMTGLGLKMSSLLISWAGGNLVVLLILTMVVGIILGMGLPTSGVYVVLVVLVAPALIELGVVPLAAHMFVFYFGIVSVITPPVALAAYVAAGIADANVNSTGWQAVKLGMAGFILPYMFIFDPAILLIGSVADIVRCTITTIIALGATAMALQGIPYANLICRSAMFVGALCLFHRGAVTDVIGLIMIAASLLIARYLTRTKHATI